MKVNILLTIPPGHSVRNCTLTLETVRVGFPNADICVTVNPFGEVADRFELNRRIRSINAKPVFLPKDEEMTHFNWINVVLSSSLDEPQVLLDGDVIFWDSVENIDLTHVLMGQFIPDHISPFYNCFCFSRLHTALLFIRSGKELLARVRAAWPGRPEISGHPQASAWFHQDLIRPHYDYILGKPVVYDTCSTLYHAIDGREFVDELILYDHLNSASFYQVMQDHVMQTDDERKNFEKLHAIAELDPYTLRGLWRKTDEFYKRRAISLHDYLYPSSREQKPV